jgi:hypothetical protein
MARRTTGARLRLQPGCWMCEPGVPLGVAGPPAIHEQQSHKAQLGLHPLSFPFGVSSFEGAKPGADRARLDDQGMVTLRVFVSG